MQRVTSELSTEPLSALSADIRQLGNLLGEIIREQHGDEALALVERIRAIAKNRRKSESDPDYDPQATAALMAEIEGLDLESKRILIKAFSNYFQLINIAEDMQRIRVLRQREMNGTLGESIDAAIKTLRDTGLDAAAVRALLDKLCVRLVLTAHPSEAKRREVLVKLRQITQTMSIRDRQTVLPREKRALDEALAEEIEELWQTRPTRAQRTTVADEVGHGLYFLTTTIMDVVVDLYTDLQYSLEKYYPEGDWRDLPIVLRYASWIGGDRDGNPNVTSDVSMETLDTMQRAARQAYLNEIAFLREHLTQSANEVSISPELVESVSRVGAPPARNADEIYRRKMDLIWGHLNADGYKTTEEFLNDLLMIDQSLRQHRGLHVANGTLHRLIQKVRVFGLHLLPLDIREDAQRHAAALDELFRYYGQCDSYIALPEEEKQALLTHEIASPRPFFPAEPAFSETANQVIETWRMIASAHRKYGKAVIDTVIASMSQAPSDVLAMLMLASEVGIQNDVDLVPLFETIDDLHRAPAILLTLFDNPEYQKHLAARGMRQQVMIGYSDSNKDGGYIASNWGLYTAQQSIARLCKNKGIALELFHGRGGSIGRGGGPANRAILSQPASSIDGRIKMTEQGEVIAYRYGNPDIARRHLHQVMHAVLLATGAPPETEVRPEWWAAMDALSETGRVAYRAFVYEQPGFLDYWQQATPIDELANLSISSRPARRRKGGFAGLRAIPWVFSWVQSRAIIPSWYGVGQALEQFCQHSPDGLKLLKEMYVQWPFFNALVENVQLDLAKADMGIAELYASLVKDEELRERVLKQMKAEHARACKLICQITDQKELLSNSPIMQRSIERRNPYVDPLNFIQVALLRELRQLEPDTPAYKQILAAVLFTINGIAAGMKTTG
jgi:phosphoenolpyruvate carboxylase